MTRLGPPPSRSGAVDSSRPELSRGSRGGPHGDTPAEAQQDYRRAKDNRCQSFRQPVSAPVRRAAHSSRRIAVRRPHAVERFLLLNPTCRGMVEWLVLVGTGVCGLAFSWTGFSIFPFTTITMNVGVALAFGVVVTLILSMLSVVHWVATALAEERALLRRFPTEYGRYVQRVRWRMIPGVF